MEIFLGERKHDRDFRLLLSDPREVEEFLIEANERWVEWFDFSTAELNDDPYVSEMLAQRGMCVLWRLRTKDGVEANVFIGLEIERGMIQVDYRLEESEGATLWRLFRPLIDSKLARLGLDADLPRPGASRSMKPC